MFAWIWELYYMWESTWDWGNPFLHKGEWFLWKTLIDWFRELRKQDFLFVCPNLASQATSISLLYDCHSLHCRCSLFPLPNHFLQFLGLFLVLNFITLSASIFCCSSFPYLQLSIYVLMNVIFLLLGWKLIHVMPCFFFFFLFDLW